jgi:hypothetical protein
MKCGEQTPPSRRNLLTAGFKVELPGWSPRDLHYIEIESADFIDTFASLASDPMDTGGDFPVAKRPGREADHSPPSSVEVKNSGPIPPLPHICLHEIVLN